MNRITNLFSVLHLDAEDDKEQLTGAVASKDENATIRSDKGQKRGKLSEIDNSLESDKVKQGNLTTLGDYKMPLVWIDLEMTGLDITNDRILEIACVVTDGKLIKSVEGPNLVIHQSKECLDSMGEWCRSHHAASGLTKRVLQSTLSEHDAEKQVLDFVKKHIGSHTPQLAGNSVYVDFLFLKEVSGVLTTFIARENLGRN